MTEESYPVKIIFFRIILSGSILLKEPMAATVAGVASSLIFRAIKGRGGNEIGAYTEATEKRPGWRNLSIFCLSALKLSEENMGLQSGGRGQKEANER